jgi:DNA-binding NtrC family response regulator
VLVVEDNAGLRRAALQQLTALGYTTHAADNAQAALDILAAGNSVDLLFTDVVMPGDMDGIELALQATGLHPGLRVLLTSGFPDLRGSEPQGTSPDYRLLNKPYRHDDLAHAVRQVMERGTRHVGQAMTAVAAE